MSHISKIELEVNDLGTLDRACRRLELQLVKGQKTFKWFGRKAGDCDHAIRVPEAEYEIGITSADGIYELKCDYYDRLIGRAIGENGGLLKQAYAVEKTMAEARRKGYLTIEKEIDTGIRLHVRVN
jgi:YD repeat-containing protein